MVAWISENLATILIAAGLAAVLTVIIAVMVHDKRKGKSSCGGNCTHCPMGGCSHRDKSNIPAAHHSAAGNGKKPTQSEKNPD